MKKELTVGYDEIFHFAEKKFKMHWNECSDVFYKGHETLQSPESSNKRIYLEDTKADLKYAQDKTGKYYNANREKTYEVLIAFMEENNLKEMLVLND